MGGGAFNWAEGQKTELRASARQGALGRTRRSHSFRSIRTGQLEGSCGPRCLGVAGHCCLGPAGNYGHQLRRFPLLETRERFPHLMSKDVAEDTSLANSLRGLCEEARPVITSRWCAEGDGNEQVITGYKSGGLGDEGRGD